MFFPGSSSKSKVSLGGRSKHEASREDIVARSREARRNRAHDIKREQAARTVQKVWRGHRTRAAQRRLWRAELAQLLDGAAGESASDALTRRPSSHGQQQPSPILSRFFAAAQPEAAEQLPLLCRVCLLARECIAHDADAPQRAFSQFDANRLAAIALRTLAYHRDALRLALEQPLCAPQKEPALRQSVAVCQTLHALLTLRAGHTGAGVASHLASAGLLQHLAAVLTALPEQRASQPSAAESIADAFCEAWRPAADPPLWGWALLCVPRVLQRCTALQRCAPVLLRLAMPHLAAMTASTTATGGTAGSRSLVGGLLSTAGQLGLGAGDAPRARAAQCGLHLLAGLLQVVMEPGGGALSRADALALLTTCRTVLALLPAQARVALVHDAVRALDSRQRGAATVLRTAWLGGSGAAGAVEDADAAWYLPAIDQAELRNAATAAAGAPAQARTADGDVIMSDAGASPRSGATCVAFEVSLADPALLTRVASGALAGGAEACGDAVAAAEELARWLLMLQDLCGSDALVRQQLEAAWKDSALHLVRSLWRDVLRPALTSGALRPGAGLKSASSPPPWLLPLAALCSLYSHFLETESDAVIFSDAAPIPLSELGGDGGDDAGTATFIPFLRDALLKTFVASGARGGGRQSQSLFRPTTSGPAQAAESAPARAPDATVVTGFKIVGGRLLGQLHSRAARRDDVPDTWFHAPGVQRAQFRKEVTAAINTEEIFAGPSGDAEHADAAEAATSGMAYIEVLRYAPCLVPFEERARVFQDLIERDKQNVRADSGMGVLSMMSNTTAPVMVRRDDIFADGFAGMRALSSVALKSRLRIEFQNRTGGLEAGIDGGGLFKEFLELLIKEAFDPKAGLFLATADGELYPNPAAQAVTLTGLPGPVPPQQVFEFLGRMLGKAMYEGIIVEVPLARFLLKQVRGHRCDLNDLPSRDRAVHANLLKLTQLPPAALDATELYFTIDDAFGREVKLLPGGDTTRVTKDNLALYLLLVADYRLNREIAPFSGAFLGGLADLVVPAWLRMFNDRELQQLICGSLTGGLDVGDMQRNCEFGGGFDAEHPTVQWLWRLLGDLEPAQQAAFLKFVTGCSRPPLLGFAELRPKLAINMRGHVGNDEDERALPSSSTCFNLLRLPPYRDEQTMRAQVLYAIEAGLTFDLS